MRIQITLHLEEDLYSQLRELRFNKQYPSFTKLLIGLIQIGLNHVDELPDDPNDVIIVAKE